MSQPETLHTIPIDILRLIIDLVADIRPLLLVSRELYKHTVSHPDLDFWRKYRLCEQDICGHGTRKMLDLIPLSQLTDYSVIYATQVDNLEIIKGLIERGVKMSCRNTALVRRLRTFVNVDIVDIVKWRVAHNKDVDYTILMLACCHDSIRIIEYFYNAFPMMQTCRIWFDLACRFGSLPTVVLLHKSGAKTCTNALYDACRAHKLDIVDYLLSCRPPIYTNASIRSIADMLRYFNYVDAADHIEKYIS